LPLTDYLKHLAEKKIIVADDFQFSAQMLIEMAKGPLHTRSLLLPDKVATDEEIEHQVAQAVEIFLNAHQC
jgi:TetR/AcrR family transcriptional repressor of mexJK operon